MRIAVVSTPFVRVPPATYGGTELVVAALVEGLAARGHDVTLYATGDSRARCTVRAFFAEACWPPDPVLEMAHAAWAMRDVRLRGADVVHVHAPSALCHADDVGAPVVYTLHHAPDPRLAELYRAVAGDARMVAISARQRDVLGLGLATPVVHHGLWPRRYRLGGGAGGYVAFLGRFAPEKGAHAAVDAARRAGLAIRVAGRCHPPDVEYWRRELVPRFTLPGVHAMGEADPRRKVDLLGDALATLFPIDWEEPFGLVMIESMLCGTPVIAYRRGAAPEIVDEGVTGFLVDDVDGLVARLEALARGPFDRVACRRRAMRRFGAERMVEDYLDVYRGVTTQALELVP
ncbi:MAG: glycosyltransferase family 4 protein [Myxococcota bacterium]